MANLDNIVLNLFGFFFLFQCSKIVNGGTKGAKNYGKSQTKESDIKVNHGTNWDKRLE